MSNKVSKCISNLFSKKNLYPIVSVDGNYTTIKKNNELVVLHPSIDKVTLFKRVGGPAKHRFELENIHSTRCRCTKCDDLHLELAQAVKELSTPVYATYEDEVNQTIDRFRNAGYNIAGVINKNDPEEFERDMKGLFQSLKEEKDAN